MDQTLFLLLIDESLSMRPKRNDIIDGINRYIDVQREINPDSRLILIKFNNNITIVHKATNIKMVEKLKLSDYQPNGRTCLFDTIIFAIKLTEELSTKENERIICYIITDGEDNFSQKYPPISTSLKEIQKLLKKYESKSNWSFTYIGKSFEYWTRKKSLSKISYKQQINSLLQPSSNLNKKSVFEQKRQLRLQQLQQQQQHQQSSALTELIF